MMIHKIFKTKVLVVGIVVISLLFVGRVILEKRNNHYDSMQWVLDNCKPTEYDLFTRNPVKFICSDGNIYNVN